MGNEHSDVLARDWPLGLLDAVADGEWNCDLPPDIVPAIAYVLAQLGEREREILLMRFRDGLTLKQAGGKYGVSGERARQKEAHALRRLRHPTRLRLLQYGVQGVIQQARARALAEASAQALDDLYTVASAVRESGLPCLQGSCARAGHCPPCAEPKPCERPEPPAEKRRTPIDGLGLSTRAYNVLYRARIETIEQLVEMDERSLARLRNCGQKTAYEIKSKLAQAGRSFAGKPAPEAAAGGDAP